MMVMVLRNCLMVTLKILTHGQEWHSADSKTNTAFNIRVAGIACFHQHHCDSKIRIIRYLFNTK